MRIDAHQHFWKLERGDYDWLNPSYRNLYQDYLPQHITPLLKQHSIDKTILVQAAATLEETDYMLSIYEEHDFVAGVVGWLDIESPSFPNVLDEYLQKTGFIGIRPMIQDIEDVNWILKDAVIENIKYLHKRDVPFDILIQPRHLTNILKLLDMMPNLRGIINHLAKPNIKEMDLDPWSAQIAAVARYPNIMCKVSGLVTCDDHDNWSINNFQPFVDHIVENFGENRILFATDWPFCMQAASYEEVFESTMRCMRLSESQLKKFMGLNAINFYKLGGELNV